MPTAESLSTMEQASYVALGDGRYAQLITGTAGGASAAPLETVIPVIARATSIMASGEASAPASGADIAATVALDAGTWDIEIYSTIGGTTVAALESFNMRVLANGVDKGRIINPVPGTAGATGAGYRKFRYDGAGIILVEAAEAATASSYYAVDIVCTRVN